MYYNLIRSIRLFSDSRSVSFRIDNASDHLWLLRHFRGDKISNKNIIYQETPSHRARKGTVYKNHCLLKQFDSIPALLAYLDSKRYTLQLFEIEFTSGWKLTITSNMFLTVKTNTTEERDALIHKMISIAGLEAINIESLEIDSDYKY
jgi:hypothetical protein